MIRTLGLLLPTVRAASDQAPHLIGPPSGQEVTMARSLRLALALATLALLIFTIGAPHLGGG
jgi:hypothetical protein